MKTLLIVVVSAIVGIALGVGFAVMQLRWAPWDSRPDEGLDIAASPKTPADAPKPKVVVELTEYSFGAIDRHFGGSHSFTITNAGNAVLSLAQGKTSSPCLTTKVDRDSIPPGESAKVILTWKPSEDPTSDRQTATIQTSDPFRPDIELAVSGRITSILRPSAEKLDFGRIFSSIPAAAQVRLWCDLEETLEITGHRWSDPSMDAQAEVSIQSLSAEDLKEEPLARSGALVKVALKPGLPEGKLQATLELETNLKSIPSLKLPLAGSVGLEIGLLSPLWNASGGVLRLGTITSAVGKRQPVMLNARGPLRKDVAFRIARTKPAFLRAALGESGEIGEGQAMQTPLTIEIPPGTPSSDHLGPEPEKMGEIVIETTNPRVPTLCILVSFAVVE